ncbi:MAG: hypothetical protein Q8M11_09565 [Sulfuritalea sp.]|nr:hypothetical protein [Sulfuritalea sp.]MDP1984032.1 hypothetical protein [Sulfuritalea sp.]
MNRTVIFFAAFLVSIAARSQSSEPINLTTDEVVTLIKGKSLSTENTRWGSVSLQFKEDGTLYGSNNGGSDSGKWRVAEGKLCLDWQRWDYEGCGVVRRAGNEIQHLWPNGGVHFIYRP